MALINAQTQQKLKLNITNIKSPIGKIGSGRGSIPKFGGGAFGGPLLKKVQPLDIDVDRVKSNILLAETNAILVDIQGILSQDFASRILQDKAEISNIRKSGDRNKRDSAESGVEAVKKFGKGVGKQFDAVLAPAKSIWNKVLNVLGILGTGFLLDKGLDFFKDQKNLDKITGFFNFLDKHGTTILAILGGVLVFKIIRKIQKLYKSLRAAWQVARNITRRIQGKPPLPKPKPKVKITKGTGGNRFRNPLRSRTKITGTGSSIKNPFKPKPKITGNVTKTPGPLKKAFKFVDDGAKGLGKKILSGFGKKGMTKGVLKFIRPFLKRIPFIGVLIDFGLSVALGEDPGRAAFGAIGAGLLAAIGTLVGGPVGMLLGGLGGDWAGRKLYDLFFGGKKESADVDKKQKMNKGGTVMGKNVGNQDSQLIHATVGEKVVNRKDSKRFGPFIDDINSNGGTLITDMMASIQAQESNMESFAAANAKLTSLLGSFTDTTNTQKKNIRTTIPISTPQIANKELKKSTSGNSSSQVITLPSIQKGGNQSAPAPVAGGTDITPIAAEDPSNSYLAYTMSGLGIYGS